MIAEVSRPGRDRPVERLIPTVVASTLGFAVLYPVIGYTFLRIYQLPAYDLKVWHMFVAVGVGVMCAVVAVLTGVTMKLFARLAERAGANPVALAGGGGLVIGLLAYLVPLTLFSGSTNLEVVVDQGPALGVGLLIATVLAKMITFAVSFSTGFMEGQSSRCSSSAARPVWRSTRSSPGFRPGSRSPRPWPRCPAPRWRSPSA